jgi:hypothetical protein
MAGISKERQAAIDAEDAILAGTKPIKREGKRSGTKTRTAPPVRSATAIKKKKTLPTIKNAAKVLSNRHKQIDKAVRKATR